MEEASVRLLVAGPRTSDSKMGILITLIILLPLVAPISTSSAELQISAEDFDILSQLDSALETRSTMVGNAAVTIAANNALDQVRLEERLSNANDPLARIDESMSNMVMVNSTPPEPAHPTPYEMVLVRQKVLSATIPTTQTILRLYTVLDFIL